MRGRFLSFILTLLIGYLIALIVVRLFESHLIFFPDYPGRLEGDCVRCMYHGLKFDPTGKCIQIPGQDNIPKNLGVRSYPALERDHLVWIWMGDPRRADPGRILDFPYLRDPAWRGRPDYMHYKANYLLIVDNLSAFLRKRVS